MTKGFVHIIQKALLVTLVLFTLVDAGAINIIRNYTVEDGLPSSEIYSVYQDFEGNLWFCTDRGVSRFDGYSFKNFSTDDGLSYNTVFRIIEDPKGNLWFTGFNGSLSYWDIKQKKFIRFKHNESLQKKLGPYNWVHLIDFRGDSMLIYPYMKRAVYLTVKKEDHLKELEINEYLPEKKLRISPDSSLSNKYIIQSLQGKSPHYHIVKTQKINDDETVIRRIESVFQKHETEVKITDIYCFEDTYLFSTHDGLYIFKDGKLENVAMKGTVVSGAIRDGENNIWITTTNEGVFLARLDDIKTIDGSEVLKSGERITVITNFKGHVLVGTNNGRVIDYLNRVVIGKINNEPIIHSFNVRNDTLLVSYGMVITAEKDRLKVDYIRKFRQHYIIVPTTGRKHFFTSFDNYGFYQGKDKKVVAEGRILHAHVVSKGSVFYSKFMGIWEARGNDLEHIKDHTRTLKIENTTVRKIYDIGDSLIVLATSGSGIVIGKNGVMITKITTKHGLPSNMINACFVDEKNQRIWCSTNRGVSILDFRMDKGGFKILRVINLNRSHGIVSNFITGITAKDDHILLAGDVSISSIPRNFILPKIKAPKVIILSLLSNDSNYLHKKTKFKHKEDNFEIFYNSFSQQRPLDGSFYRYRLRSPQQSEYKWTYTNDRGVWFKDLSAGQYTFEVSARSLNSEWSIPASVQFTIEPIFLSLWWVRITILLSLGLIAFLFVRRYFLRIQMESDKALEIQSLHLKNNRLELAALRGQMNPHFIFNALKSIQKLILAEQKWEANELLNKFSKLIRSSLEYSRTDFIPLTTEIQFLENYLEIEQSRAPDKFTFRINIAAVNDLEDIKIPGLLIQPICENAVKHAFQGADTGLLEVVFEQDSQDGIIVKVIDNGIGFFNAKPRGSDTQHSMGLDIVQSRLDLFSEQGYDTWLKISPMDPSTNKGTIVTFKLPGK